jgi:hypothetical protein
MVIVLFLSILPYLLNDESTIYCDCIIVSCSISFKYSSNLSNGIYLLYPINLNPNGNEYYNLKNATR